jgi:hypothetical protein
MSNDTKFIDGLIVKAPNEHAPEYVKAKLSIKNAELIAFLQGRLDAGEEWTNADVKVSQGGKWYAAVDDWKPEGNGGRSGSRGGAPSRERPQRATEAAGGDTFDEDSIPFVSQRGAF